MGLCNSSIEVKVRIEPAVGATGVRTCDLRLVRGASSNQLTLEHTKNILDEAIFKI